MSSRRLSIVPLAQRPLAYPTDFLSSILIDGPLGGLETWERWQGVPDVQPGHVLSYAQRLL
jgi:hypothetical protein